MRVTDAGTMCQSCTFQRALSATRNEAAAAGSYGTQSPAAAGFSSEGFLFGLVIGLVCGVFGLAWVFASKRGADMKRGVTLGFIVGAVIMVLARGMLRVSQQAPEE